MQGFVDMRSTGPEEHKLGLTASNTQSASISHSTQSRSPAPSRSRSPNIASFVELGARQRSGASGWWRRRRSHRHRPHRHRPHRHTHRHRQHRHRPHRHHTHCRWVNYYAVFPKDENDHSVHVNNWNQPLSMAGLTVYYRLNNLCKGCTPWMFRHYLPLIGEKLGDYDKIKDCCVVSITVNAQLYICSGEGNEIGNWQADKNICNLKSGQAVVKEIGGMAVTTKAEPQESKARLGAAQDTPEQTTKQDTIVSTSTKQDQAAKAKLKDTASDSRELSTQGADVLARQEDPLQKETAMQEGLNSSPSRSLNKGESNLGKVGESDTTQAGYLARRRRTICNEDKCNEWGIKFSVFLKSRIEWHLTKAGREITNQCRRC